MDFEYGFSLEKLWQICGGQLILLIAGLLFLLIEIGFKAKTPQKKLSIMGWLTTVVLVLALGHIVYREWNLHEVVFMGIFSMEKFTAFLSAIVLMAGIMASILSIGYLKNNEVFRSEYFVLLLFSVYGTIAFLQSIDLLMIFITLEIMSIGVYCLAAFLRDDRRSAEGAMKYFLIGSFGSCFYLFGMALLYGFTGTINLTKLSVILSHGPFTDPLVLVALAMIMVGLLFKISMVPFHMWAPDVYEGSPSVVTGFMATAVKAAAIGVFIKIMMIGFGPMLSLSGQPEFANNAILSALGSYWKPVLWWIALLTMFFGNLVAVSQKNVKRMLAYSSIAHAGYMALGILAENDMGRMGVLFYLFSYTLMNLGAFGVIYCLDGKERNAQTLEDYRGLGYKYPGLSFLISLFLVAMAGLPPTAGFIGKFYVFAAAIRSGYIVLAALGILTSVIGAYYYLRVIYMLYMKDPVREVEIPAVSFPTAVVLIFAAIGVIYLGVLPQGLADIADAAQRTLSLVF
ncbi:NADH-ubiquinone oxidoreductase chain N [Dissulfuribacter thermophilus]|uniref:NADH-quinone oxidoreductase subunit N n=1 Tax=Dissulfuribacter thermophilus TaxID=1156395 RepID=A0A1B9F3W6_9BACT|nr:NADH-quinone oxidoreductase subunit N [Dissulfuribacter thermophilus]OCC14612.1 NADH-ubiquinone oxidoreductase chain N [Dissulfuribacter thermophilus]